jgi:two-component system OmpR family response regulator
MRNEGVVTRTQILDHLWGYDYDSESNLVDVYVVPAAEGGQRAQRQLIRTVRGSGTRWVTDVVR